MDYKLSLFLAAVLLLVIAGIRRRLTYELQGSSLLIFGSARTGVLIYSFIFLPGTILHELSHWLMAEILQVPTGRLRVLPDFESEVKGEERLGYVMTGQAGPIRGFLIGFAPLLTGIIALMILGYTLETVWGQAPWWQVALVIYGLVVVGNSMIVSRADRRNWPVIAILIVLLIVIFTYLQISIPETQLAGFNRILIRINQVLGLTIGLNLAMIVGSYALRRGLEKVTKKKIVFGRQQ